MSTTVLNYVPKISNDVSPGMRQALTLVYQKLNNHAQAMALLAQKQSGSTTSNVTQEIVNAISGEGSSGQFIGAVNDQTGNTSYATQYGDYGALVIFSDVSPVAVSLTVQSPPWMCWITNLGVGDVTLTPDSGTINGTATAIVGQGNTAVIAFDGANWWLATSPTGPSTVTAVTHEWLNSYNASTGLFTQTQPAFTDISGVAAVAQGGTGTATPALVAGTNVTITGAWPDQTINASTTGFTGTITTAKLTTGGTNGSMTFSNGLLVSQVAAT